MEPTEIVIRAQSGWIPINWRELYAYRELLFFFVWRDISARYKQTVLGSAWAVIQPLLMMIIFTFVARFVGIHPQDQRCRDPLPGLRLRRADPLDGVLPGHAAVGPEPRDKSSHDDQSVFPTFIPARHGCRGLSGRPGIFTGDLRRDLAGLPDHARLDLVFLPVLVLLTLIGTLSIGILLSALDPVLPRFPPCRALPRPDHDVYHARFLFGEHDHRHRDQGLAGCSP